MSNLAAVIPFLLLSGGSLIPSCCTHMHSFKNAKSTRTEMNIMAKDSNLQHIEEEDRIVLKIPDDDKSLYAFFQQDQEVFLLGNAKVQYVMQLDEAGKLTMLHWGKSVSTLHPLPYYDRVSGGDEYSSIYSDYPIYGDGDDREPALKLSSKTTGITSFDFKYKSHELYDGKKGELGDSCMPCTYTESNEEAKTLMLKMYDEDLKVEIRLYYTIFRDYNAIARHTEIENHGDETVLIERLASWSLDLPPSPNERGYRYLQLQGAWAREGGEVWNNIDYGKYIVGDMEGSQVHRANPFIAVTDGDVTEDHGVVRAFSYIYSGSFQAVLQMNQMGLLRVNMGMHPDIFRWKLESGETLISPECVGVYSNNGLGPMSRDFHHLYRTRLARGQWRDKLRPILLNTWEPFNFNFTHDTLIDLAKSAQGTGVELFVLDDGWFGARDSINAGLGDWYPNMKKLPKGLVGLAKDINDLGFEFGLWVEPESVNPDSDFYRKHPEWAVEVPGKPGVLMRNQLLLDLANIDVQNHLIEVLTEVFSSANISYVKWDHNRFISNPYSRSLSADRQAEFSHRYMLGLYNVVKTATQRFPHILFESCAGGGGRFDPAFLAYMPQSWGSDNTDAEERVKIQWGYSYAYPSSMVGAHVSTIPNHQVERVTAWESRTSVAHFGTFGYELNTMELSKEEKEQAAIDSNCHKAIRHLVHHGDFYRMRSPYKSNWPGWMCVSKDSEVSEAIVFGYQRLRHSRETVPAFVLKGLDENKEYAAFNIPSPKQKRRYSGDELMTRGLTISFDHDFEGHLYYLCDFDYYEKVIRKF